jgi:hypothetical protein
MVKKLITIKEDMQKEVVTLIASSLVLNDVWDTK